MRAKGIGLLGAAAIAALTGGCGEVARTGRAPVQLVITRLEAQSGAGGGELSGTLNSDVITIVQRTIAGDQVDVPTIFSDQAEVVMRLVLRDPGIPGVPAAPSALNDVTITRYRVVYRRADGRNTPGVDVPYPFDSGLTFTISGGTDATATFEIVRHTAKQEPPLVSLRANGVNLSTIAEVTFYGRDQAGNEITVTGQIGIIFGNFGDPT